MSIGNAFRVDPIDLYKDYGDLSAVDQPYRRRMSCEKCRTKWYGCWDSFQCPECGDGDLPRSLSAWWEERGFEEPHWWQDHGELSRLLRWLHAGDPLSVPAAISIVEKPWNWDQEYTEMCEEQRSAPTAAEIAGEERGNR
jgi:hypothetical protein